MSKQQVSHIIDTLGSEALQARLGVSHHSIRAARTMGRFSAGWFGPMELMCGSAGIACPRELFNWVVPIEGGDDPASGQEEQSGTAPDNLSEVGLPKLIAEASR